MRRFDLASVLLMIALCAVPCLGGPTLPATGNEPPRGALVIVGGGRTPQAAIARGLELAGGPKAHVVVITFAYPNATGRASASMWQQAGAENVAILTVDDMRSTALAEVRKADVIWFLGGSQVRLMHWLGRLDLIDAVRQRFQAGAVIGGTSAGAAVMSAVMLTGAGDLAHAEADGLGLWANVIVDQHYLRRHRQARLEGAVLRHPDLVGIGIDEGTAVILRGEGRHFDVLGASQVEVVVRKGAQNGTEVTTRRLHAGEAFDLRR
jgi:cyanophycinase